MIALLFPGQGAQEVGMGEELAQAFPTAERTFAEADDVLGYALSGVCFRGPVERLT
ncbi:MAG: malonyl CoA-acyl carrier protein transacylase, partial [Thermoleophilia bacterium]|nr:malonyl CoA-acyl carrier protein transacylase [Thermoleophilia bacterium]